MVRVLVCDVRLRAQMLDYTSTAAVHSTCASVTAARPGRLDLNPGDANRQDLLVSVTPRQPGVVRIAGLQLQYRVGDRRGHEQSGSDMVFRTKAG